jgi:hypothetical protein
VGIYEVSIIDPDTSHELTFDEYTAWFQWMIQAEWTYTHRIR